jgi:hypothetical protein
VRWCARRGVRSTGAPGAQKILKRQDLAAALATEHATGSTESLSGGWRRAGAVEDYTLSRFATAVAAKDRTADSGVHWLSINSIILQSISLTLSGRRHERHGMSPIGDKLETMLRSEHRSECLTTGVELCCYWTLFYQLPADSIIFLPARAKNS